MSQVTQVSDEEMQGALVQEDSVEVVVAEEDSKLIRPQALLEALQSRIRQLAGRALQEILKQACLCGIPLLLHHNCHTSTAATLHPLMRSPYADICQLAWVYPWVYSPSSLEAGLPQLCPLFLLHGHSIHHLRPVKAAPDRGSAHLANPS